MRTVYSVKRMQRHRSPAIADRAVRRKVTERQVEIRWKREAGKVWKEKGRKRERNIGQRSGFGSGLTNPDPNPEQTGYKTKVRDTREVPEKGALERQVDEE